MLPKYIFLLTRPNNIRWISYQIADVDLVLCQLYDGTYAEEIER